MLADFYEMSTTVSSGSSGPFRTLRTPQAFRERRLVRYTIRDASAFQASVSEGARRLRN